MANDRPVNEEVVFRCPCCGGVFNIKRLTEDDPFLFEQTTRHFGGKTPLSDYERKWRVFESMGRGSGHGKIKYDPWQNPAPEIIKAYRRRLKEVEDTL